MKPTTIKLKKYESIIAVVPEYCSGPGWSNCLVWVHIADSQTGAYRQRCLQQNEWTPDMFTLFSIGKAMAKALVSAVPIKETK